MHSSSRPKITDSEARFKRRTTAVLKSNLIRAIEFGTAVARRLKRASLSVIFGLEKFAACVQDVMVYFVVVG